MTNEIYHRAPKYIEIFFAKYIDNNNYETNEESKENYESNSFDAIPINLINDKKLQIFTQFLFKHFTSWEPNGFTRHIKTLLQFK